MADQQILLELIDFTRVIETVEQAEAYLFRKPALIRHDTPHNYDFPRDYDYDMYEQAIAVLNSEQNELERNEPLSPNEY